jgi:hypothetical protein
MATPSTRQGLIDFCLRRLGEPVLEVNVDEDQIEDKVDDALQLYQEYHDDASAKTYYAYQMTEEDLTMSILHCRQMYYMSQEFFLLRLLCCFKEHV